MIYLLITSIVIIFVLCIVLAFLYLSPNKVEKELISRKNNEMVKAKQEKERLEKEKDDIRASISSLIKENNNVLNKNRYSKSSADILNSAWAKHRDKES